ncbi:MAG: ATP-binding cassette domain-containing protein [Candidatus Izimaplasma sp.]|nr:ATP-binding cassette domain-containing protein [Candidatus Izimaplasma bacterium]
MAKTDKIKLDVNNLTVSFGTTQGRVRAVRGVSFKLREGETLAVVGESGSGKSVTARTIMGILAGNGTIDDGEINYAGEDLTKIAEDHFHELRGDKVGMIFQDPMSSLNPIMRIGRQITEGLILKGKHLKNREKKLYHEAKARVDSLHREIKHKKKQMKDKKEALKKQETEELEKIEENNSYKTKSEVKAEIKQELSSFKTKTRKDIQSLKVDLKKAKVILRKDKAKAKKIVRQEWRDEKARVIELIKQKKEEIKNATPERQAKIKAEIADLKEGLRRYKKVTKKQAKERAIQVMEEVGIDNPEQRFRQYPFQFSGGMRQRIVIAIALTANPDILICDEPTTALDVTIQAQILELIEDLKIKHNLSVIFITHDLGVVANMADRIAVMYAGKFVELGTAEDIFYDPKHPYTWALLSSMPDLDSKEKLNAIPGTPPNMLFPPKGDAFADRNEYAMKIDYKKQPPMFDVSETHKAATWLLHEDAPKVEMPDIIKHRIERMLKNSEKEVSK